MKAEKMNPKVDWYFKKSNWPEEMKKLRTILLDTELIEELKWGKPCYTFQERNVVILQGFKEFCALLFAKGALLKDPEGILEKPGQNTQAARRIPFTRAGEIVKRKAILKSYLKEAIEVEKAGLEVSYRTTEDFAVPEEFQKKLAQMPVLKIAFAALTPGRQRGYLFYFSGAKQSKTREARVEKSIPQILKGKGLDDK